MMSRTNLLRCSGRKFFKVRLASIVILGIAFFLVGCRKTGGGVFKSFVRAIAKGDEQEAESYLSAAALAKAKANCPYGSVVVCFDRYLRPEWEDASEFAVDRAVGDMNGVQTSTWSVRWTNDVDYSTEFTVHIIDENGGFRIDSCLVNGEDVFAPR